MENSTESSKLRLVRSGYGAGAYNMALDEALWQRFGDKLAAGEAPEPVLRLYGWQPAALSIGYAQRAEREVDLASCERLGLDWVRRPTGGRAILHEKTELTYSLVGAVADPYLGGSVLESYRKISGALLAGLELLGIQASLAGKEARGADGAASPACFDAPSAYEVTFAGRKLIGSAQARRHETFLQQGTILLGVDVRNLFEVLLPPPRLSRAEAIRQVAGRLTSIELVLGRSVAYEEAEEAFRAAFARHFNADLIEEPPDEVEEELAVRLLREKYANPAWNLVRQRPLPAFR